MNPYTFGSAILTLLESLSETIPYGSDLDRIPCKRVGSDPKVGIGSKSIRRLVDPSGAIWSRSRVNGVLDDDGMMVNMSITIAEYFWRSGGIFRRILYGYDISVQGLDEKWLPNKRLYLSHH